MDGRHLRSERTRAAVVGALLELIREGDLRPTAERIAARAGVSERTVFQHFKDRETMFAAMGELQTEAVKEIWQRVPREGSYDERLDAFLNQRVRLLEFVSPTRKAALLEEPHSPVTAEGLTLIRGLMRKELERVFEPELGGSAERAAAAAAVSGWSFWNNLRTHQGLPEADARAVLRRTLDAVLSR